MSHTQNTTLREAVFRAPEGQKSSTAPTITVSPIVGKIKVYTLPRSREGDVRMLSAWHLFLIAAGASSSVDRKEWQTYVVTLSCLCLPEIRTAILASPAFEEVVFSESAADGILDWSDNIQAANSVTAEAELREACKEAAEEHRFSFTLPSPKVATGINMDDLMSVESIYGHFSLVLFLAGKTITDDNRTAITQKRPNAIERKYFMGRAVASLTGPLALSGTAHGMIHTAFVNMTVLRKNVFERVARFGMDQDAPHVEVMATTTRLMRFSGMQQAVLIDQFLSAHEEAFRVPFLAPPIAAYTASLRDLERAPAELRPYYKLIYGDTTRAFNRNDISNLLTVALMDARELNPSLQRYNIPANHELVMAKYMQSLEALAEDEEN